jgi:hypothetical protein
VSEPPPLRAQVLGELAAIAASLCAVRPRRTRRLVPARVAAGAIIGVLGLAAGPIAEDIAPHVAVAAESVGPSPRGCAEAFDSGANATVRGLVPKSGVLRVQIITTPIPSCVIRFQLQDQRVLTAQAPWRRSTAIDWGVSIRRPGLVAGENAIWHAGRLTANGLGANVPLRLGPPPTTESCLDAWNSSPPPVVRTLRAAEPALVEAFTGGVYIATGSGASQPGNGGYACAVSLVEHSGHTLLVSGAWQSAHSAEWGKPVKVVGLVFGATPNADIAADGRLSLRTPKPTRQVAPNPSVDPSVSREIGATGWAGGFKLHDTLAVAIRRFGKPAEEAPNGLACQVSWPKLGLSAMFEFGFVRNGQQNRQPAQCAPNGRAMSLTGVSTWSTAQGLRVGAPATDVARRYPGASRTTSSTGVTTWYLVPRRAGTGGLALTAQVTRGRVTTITVAVASNTFGFAIGG